PILTLTMPPFAGRELAHESGKVHGLDLAASSKQETLHQGHLCQHRSGHQSYVPPDAIQPIRQRRIPYPELNVDDNDQEESPTNRPDAESQLPGTLVRTSPEVKAALDNIDNSTQSMAATVYHENRDLANLDRFVLQLPCSVSMSTGRPIPRLTFDNSVLPSNPTIGTHSSTGDVAPRHPRDLTPPPYYEGERRRTATRRWLHQCPEYFCLEVLLTNINTTDEQRVALGTTWLKGTALHAWQSHLDAHDASPSILIPQMWVKFQE
ncbi:hypothetical protein KEM55_000047, partial [Ascosphaera atra]